MDWLCNLFFFFQAEDGIRDKLVTGVQTCALPICAPMAGIPHHAADGYIARLVREGRKIAISEPLEAPAKAKKLLKRDGVRIMTPGTITATAYPAGAANNFLPTGLRGRGARGGGLPGASTGGS